MRYVFAIFCFILISCGSHPRPLTIKDLKFPAPEKEAIANNHIWATTGIDSFQYKYSTSGNIDTQIISSLNDSFYNSEGDIFKYDQMGNIIYYLSYTYDIRRRENWVRYEYDSLGLNTLHFNGVDKFSSTYTLIPASNILSMIETVSNNYGSQPIYFDSTIFYFDTSGRLLMDIKIRKGIFATAYFYNPDGKLKMTKMKRFAYREYYTYRKYYYNIPECVTTNYYYKGNLLDSVITERFYLTGHRRKDKKYYDSDGLIHKAVFAGRLDFDSTGHLQYDISEYKSSTLMYYHKKHNE